MACDITIAADDAVFGEPELRFGSGIVTQILPWIVGPKRAKEILLTGNDRLSAAEALAMGLVNRVVPREDITAEALRTARAIAVMDGGAERHGTNRGGWKSKRDVGSRSRYALTFPRSRDATQISLSSEIAANGPTPGSRISP